jgi:hypothetical protein
MSDPSRHYRLQIVIFLLALAAIVGLQGVKMAVEALGG